MNSHMIFKRFDTASLKIAFFAGKLLFITMADLMLFNTSSRFEPTTDHHILAIFFAIFQWAADETYFLSQISQLNISVLWVTICELSEPALLQTLPHNSHITRMDWYASPAKWKTSPMNQMFNYCELFVLPSKWNRFIWALHTWILDNFFLHK